MMVALDTAGPWVCVASGDASGIGWSLRHDALAHHNEILARVFANMLESLPDPPSALAVNVGPGSFTGTRVGVSFIAGLAQALKLKVFPVSAFVLAARLAPPSASRVKVALPLVRGVYGVCELSLKYGLWHEEAWLEHDQEELDRIRKSMLLICPWGDHPADVMAPPDWNPALELVRLSVAAPKEAFAEPVALSVRYMGICQAERNFHAGRQH